MFFYSPDVSSVLMYIKSRTSKLYSTRRITCAIQMWRHTRIYVVLVHGAACYISSMFWFVHDWQELHEAIIEFVCIHRTEKECDWFKEFASDMRIKMVQFSVYFIEEIETVLPNKKLSRTTCTSKQFLSRRIICRMHVCINYASQNTFFEKLNNWCR